LRAISGLGKVDLTNDLDAVKLDGNGVKATTTTGGVEWCVIYDYDVNNQRYRIGIDSREVNGILSDPSTISSLQLFDLWNGPVTFNSYDPNGWTEVYVYTQTQFNFSGSSFASFIRAGNGAYGLRAEFTFSPIQNYPVGLTVAATDNKTFPFIEPVFIFRDANAVLILLIVPVITKRVLFPVNVNPLAAVNPL